MANGKENSMINTSCKAIVLVATSSRKRTALPTHHNRRPPFPRRKVNIFTTPTAHMQTEVGVNLIMKTFVKFVNTITGGQAVWSSTDD